MPQRPTKTPKPPLKRVRKDAQTLRGGSDARYRDRPTDDGMQGDGAQEPNAGSARLPRQGPSRRVHRSRASGRVGAGSA